MAAKTPSPPLRLLGERLVGPGAVAVQPAGEHSLDDADAWLWAGQGWGYDDGCSIVWAAEFVGSGEVILATRVGAILGPTVLWAIVVGVVLKFWIGMAGARYTVCTGEGMIDMISRVPGPKNWGVWITLVAQSAAATISMSNTIPSPGRSSTRSIARVKHPSRSGSCNDQ